MTANPIPDGFHTVTPYLIIDGATRAIDFYKEAFGATEVMRLEVEGHVGHAELQIGDSRIMLAEESAEAGFVGPATLGGSPVGIVLYVEDVDGFFTRALEAGAEEKLPVADQFYGDRAGTLLDPFGHVWTVMTHMEDLSAEELEERFLDIVAQQFEEDS
jgi:PhnB protein